MSPFIKMQRRAYRLKEWSDCEDFLTQLAQRAGKLLKGGEPDLNTAARCAPLHIHVQETQSLSLVSMLLE